MLKKRRMKIFNNMRKVFILVSLIIVFVLFSNEANAQTKKRIGLEEGADSISLKGKISGNKFALYEIWVEKDDSWDVKLNSANQYIGYTIKDPKGNRFDFLEKPQHSGYYTIRVELNSIGVKAKKVANFTLEIKFEMEKGKPIS